MKNSFAKFFALALAAFAALLLAGCEMPASWNDPAYFGDGEDMGKGVGGIGTGYEVNSPSVL